jgi:hypothetical protein
MVKRMACFFHHGQFSGSPGSSDGWGIKTVYTPTSQSKLRPGQSADAKG